MTPTAEQIIIVLAFSVAPISELRVAIPVAISQFHFDPLFAYGISVVGNLIPVVLILTFLGPIVQIFSRVRFFKRIIDWVFSYTRRRHTQKVERWGKLALLIIVAIPLPLTGAWSGSLVAFLFGISFREAFPLITLGVMIAGLIVTLFTLGIF